MSLTKCVTLEEEMKKNPELKMSDIEILKEWCKKQPHLPKISDLQLAVMLHSNYYQIESTKSTIENYFTIRTHAPEMFSNRDLIIKELRNCKVVAHIILEGKTKEGYSMMLSKLIDFEPLHYDFAKEINFGLMLIEEHIFTQGLIPGYVSIMDATGLSFGHLGRMYPVIIKTSLAYVQNAFPIRLKAVHIINSSPIIETLYNMFKSFINEKLKKLIYFHPSMESVKKYLPIETLPNENGGKAGSIEELRDASVKKLEDFREWFLEDERVGRVNESLRIGKCKTFNDFFGTEGNFKKLELD